MKVFLIRHCQAVGQEENCSLTEEGKRQAEHLSVFLNKHNINKIISSPFLRAIQSATPFSLSLNIPIEIDSRLKERNLGKTGEDWQQALKISFDNYDLVFPEGESSKDATKRALEVVRPLFENSNIVGNLG